MRPGRVQHGRVDVEPDHGATPAVQLERHPPGAAAGIEHGRGFVGIDQRGLTVHVDARGLEPGEAVVVARAPWDVAVAASGRAPVASVVGPATTACQGRGWGW